MSNRPFRRSSRRTTLAALAGLALATPVHAATLDVPAQYATIGAAITAAQPSDIIAIAAGTYKENLAISKSVTLQGAGSGQTSLNGNQVNSVVIVLPGTSVRFADLTLTNGITQNALGSGGGLFSEGTVRMERCVVTGNLASSSGAGICNFNGDMTLVDCSVSGNLAFLAGGGIENDANLTMTGCTVANNAVGALFSPPSGIGGGLVNSGTLFMTNCTVYGNQSGQGAGLFLNDGTATVSFSTIYKNGAVASGGGAAGLASLIIGSSILAGNTAPIGPDLDGAATSMGYNVFGVATGAAITPVANAGPDQSGTSASPLNPRLGDLADNGGDTQTCLPLPASPAVDKGDPAAFPATDQRGDARPQDGDANGSTQSDAGSVETLAPAPDVAARDASLISTTSATLNARITPYGSTTVQFQVKNGATYTDIGASQTISGSGTPVTVSRAVVGLPAGVPVTYRAMATNAAGTTVGADATFPTLVPSSGAALSFDGVDDYVSASIPAALAKNYTISAWVYLREGDAYTRTRVDILSKTACGGSIELLVRSNTDNPADPQYLELGRCGDFNGTPSTTPIPLNQWVNVAVSVDSGQTVTYYVNGQPAGSWSAAGLNLSLPASFELGSNVARRFNGKLDEVRVWDTALSAAQIAGAWNRRLVGNEAHLVGCWRLDESSGNTTANAAPGGSPATLVNGPGWVTSSAFDDRSPGSGGAILFNGTDAYVNIPSGTGMNLFPLTVAAWVNTTATDGERSIVNKYVAGSANGWQMHIRNGHITGWYFRDTGNCVYNTGTGIGPDGGLINDGKWHYVAFTVDNSGGTIYVDGVQKASLPWTGTPGASTSTIPVTVGVYQGVQGDPQSYFRGLMDEVSIWNVARTQADIQASMTKLLTGSEAGLAAGFGFDEDAGPAANDRTSNGRTGYLTNGAAWVPSTIPVVDAWANVRDALRITGGFAAASPADISRLDAEAGGGINLADAIRLARKATGLAN